MDKKDYKKIYKDIYVPSMQPQLIELPPISYVCVEGKGDPNTSSSFQEAISLLYGLSYTIKMNRKIDGYFEYVVPPLEGLWWSDKNIFDGLSVKDKNDFCWKLMIRLPEFVDEDIFMKAKEELKVKKNVNVDLLKREIIEEGLCVQIMHKGSFDEEAKSIEKIYQYIQNHGLASDISSLRFHHEIYLSDFRRTKTENLKTVIRHPVKKQSYDLKYR